MPKVVPGYKEEAKSRILVAAQQAFAEKGYDQTTMEDIAGKLGVSKGALYQYFNSKEELFEKIMKVRQAALSEALRASLKDGDLVESAKNFFDAVIGRHYDYNDYNVVLTFEVISEASRNATFKKILEEDYEKRIAILSEFLQEQRERGLLRDDVDIPALSMGLSALFNGLMISAILGLERSEVRRVWLESTKALSHTYTVPT